MAQNSNGPLLFVNKTSRSASLSNNRSDRTSRQKINQHVQHTRDLNRERHGRVQRLGPTRLTHRALRSSSNSPAEPSPSTTLPTPPSTPLVAISSIGSVSSFNSEDDEIQEGSPSSELSQVIPVRGTVEPFGVFRVPLDNERYRILQYFVLEMFPTISRSDTPVFNNGSVLSGEQAAAQMIRDCLTDEMHTYALMTASSGRMKFLTKAPFAQSDLPERYADKTMQLLRRHLSENRPVDERLILTIFFLWAIESYRKDWKAVRTHQEMIKYLYTTHLGGFQNLSYHLRKFIWFGDRFQATATATPPVIEVSWEPEEISAGVVSRVLKAISADDREPMGAAFGGYTITFFTPEFRILLHDVTVLACIVQCHWTDIQESYPDANWVNSRSHALLDRLLFFEDARSIEASGFAILLQDSVRLALITWLAFVGSPTTGRASQSVNDNIKIRVAVDARPLRQRFDALNAHVPTAVPEDQQALLSRLFLWIAGLGVVASEVPENITFFSEYFQRLAQKLDIKSWTKFSRMTRTFLWLDRLEAVNGFRLTKMLESQQLETNDTFLNDSRAAAPRLPNSANR